MQALSSADLQIYLSATSYTVTLPNMSWWVREARRFELYSNSYMDAVNNNILERIFRCSTFRLLHCINALTNQLSLFFKLVSYDNCVQRCDKSIPATPPLGSWCLLVSNYDQVNGIYASVVLLDVAQNTPPVSTPILTPSPSPSPSPSSTSSSTLSTTSPSPMTTFVVNIPVSFASKRSEWNGRIFFLGLVLYCLFRS